VIKKKSNVIPFPVPNNGVEVELNLPERSEPVQLLSHPDVQVTQEGDRYYRIRVGQVELTYDCSLHGAWYLYLPGHEQAVGPVGTDQYDPGNQPFMINIDRDQKDRAVGIEIV
jgi:hypothetical protein